MLILNYSSRMVAVYPKAYICEDGQLLFCGVVEIKETIENVLVRKC